VRGQWRRGVGLFYVDRHIVVGGVAVAGGAYALGHALAAVECRTTNDIASTRRRGAAVALFLDGRDIKFRFDRGGLICIDVAAPIRSPLALRQVLLMTMPKLMIRPGMT
jgi:hypothetical protein